VADETAEIPITLNDGQGHAPKEGLLKCDFSHNCAAVDKIFN